MTKPLKLIGIGILATVLALVGMTLLPHNSYVRWQSMRTEAFARLGWIYERVHYDDTPIDVAFLGTSHTLNSVDAAAVAKGLGETGLRNAQGRCPTVTNIAIPAYGRNLHWVIAREALENRDIDLLVVEIFENETRKPHDLFIHAATVKDVLTAPVLINLNAPKDAARLPFRELMLSIKSLAPEAFGLKARFDPARYDGSTVDNTRIVNVDGRALTPSRDAAMERGKLEKVAAQHNADKDLNMLPAKYARYEYAVPNRYVKDILDLAKKKHVKVAFMYLPGFRKPAAPYDMTLYKGAGDILYPATDMLNDPALWLDADHLTSGGAAKLSERLPGLLAPELASKGWAVKDGAAGACSNGYPPHQTLRPYRKGAVNG